MAYSSKRKKNGIGREYRGRKPKDYDQRVQDVIDDVVEEVSEVMHKDYRQRVYDKYKNHFIGLPDSRFDVPELYSGRGGYTPADKIAAVTAFMVTGSVTQAAKYCAVPADTIKGWRKREWWDVLTQQVKKEKNDELDTIMTGVLHSAVEKLIERLDEGDYHYDARRGVTYQMPSRAKDLAAVTAMIFDKRQLLRGDVTSRTEKVSTNERLSKLKEQFEKFSNAKDITGEAEEVTDDAK